MVDIFGFSTYEDYWSIKFRRRRPNCFASNSLDVDMLCTLPCSNLTTSEHDRPSRASSSTHQNTHPLVTSLLRSKTGISMIWYISTSASQHVIPTTLLPLNTGPTFVPSYHCKFPYQSYGIGLRSYMPCINRQRYNVKRSIDATIYSAS